MALRGSTRVLRVFSQSRGAGFSSLTAGRQVRRVGVGLAASAVVGAYAAYKLTSPNDLLSETLSVNAATLVQPQSNVISENKKHALYLWIHLKPTADAKACAKAVANIQKHVDSISPPSERDDEDEIWSGVGFGTNLYTQVTGKKTRKNYNYPHRKGSLGELPSSGGDIFVHAKCSTVSNLFDLCQRVVNSLPPGSVDKFSDVYSFVYQNGRDLSGFIDGTENPADEEHRYKVAVEKATGGSYCITQKWIHDLKVIGSERDKTLEGWVGRGRPDSVELNRKSTTSHVSRMVGGTGFGQQKMFEIVRQSMPYGNVSDHAGLFFIGFAESPENFEFMLDRMVGAAPDGQCDDVMRLTRCVAGTYWYFPSPRELQAMA